MKLNVVNINAATFSEQLGIANERANEIGRLLDAQWKSYRNTPVRVCDIYQMIAAFCNNIEEFTYATVIHTEYMIRKGITLAAPGSRMPEQYDEAVDVTNKMIGR